MTGRELSPFVPELVHDADDLNYMVNFDSPFRVHEPEAGIPRVTPSLYPEVFAPEAWPLEDGESFTAPDGWSAVSGYSGQYGYSGPVMHPSEYLGRRMAADVLDAPGVYCLCVVEYLPEEEDGETVAGGWVLLKRED